MNERKIVAALVKSRKIWEGVKDKLDPKDLAEDTNKILEYINEYYSVDSGALAVDVDILEGRIQREFTSAKRAGMLVQVLRELPEVSEINVAKELLAVKANNIGHQLAVMLSRGDTSAAARGLVAQWLALADNDQIVEDQLEDVVEEYSVSDLVTKDFNRENLIQLWPSALNERLDGGARAGHHILVFAPTEMGKTLVVINMVAGFTAQGLRTLYIGNEDPVADLQMRFICNLTGKAKLDIINHPLRAQAIVDKKGYKNVIFAPLAPGTFSKIRQLVDRFKPNIVVLDQLRNIDVDSENRTQALERAATEARNLAKSMGVLVLSVTQAGDSASGKRSLNRGDVDGSNVGIPGQVDAMIGIGATEEDELSGIRFLSFPKNKLSGNHSPLEIRIDPITSRVLEQGSAANDDNFRPKAAGVSRAA